MNPAELNKSFPHKSHHKQYHYHLYWTRDKDLDWQGAGFAFVETLTRDAKGHLRTAPLRWWRTNTSPVQLESLLKQRFGEDLSHLKIDSLVELPVETPKADYRLELQNISTWEDRDNWTARGRIRLVRLSDQTVLAEHIGVATKQNIVFRNSTWEKIKVCPGPEQGYMDSGRWLAHKFIASEMLRPVKP